MKKNILLFLFLLFGATMLNAQITVDFNIDMNVYHTLQFFDPATDPVFLMGSFNGWQQNDLMSDLNSDGIYNITIPLEENTNYEYKYFITSANAPNSGWEEVVGGGSSGNRILQTTTGSMVLPTVYFNNLDKPIKILTPNDGEYWKAGSQKLISWYGTTSAVDIQLSIDGGDYSNIVTNYSNPSFSYLWTIPNSLSDNCKIKIFSSTDGTVVDESDNPFRIVAAGDYEVLNSFDYLQQDYFYSNSSSDESKAYLHFFDSPTDKMIGDGAMKIDWSVQTSQSGGAGWANFWYNEPEGVVYDLSQCNSLSFWVNNTNPSSLPNRVQFQIILYDYSNSPNGVNTTDLSECEVYYSFFTSLLNAQPGWNKIIIPLKSNSSYWNGEGFNRTGWYGIEGNNVLDLNKIKTYGIQFLISGNNESPGEFASGSMLIDHLMAENNKFLFLLTPSGGENWVVGSTYNIKWNSGGIENVKLEYSTNDGADWTPIIASTPAADENFNWIIPNMPSNQCKVKISDVSDASANDLSDGNFTILGEIILSNPSYSWSEYYDGIPSPGGMSVVSNETILVISNPNPGPGIFVAREGDSFDINDAFSTLGAPFNWLTNIMRYPDGSLFITDSGSDIIYKIDPGQNVPYAFFDSQKSGSGQFDPYGLAIAPPEFDGPNVDPGDLIIADNGYGTDQKAVWAVNPISGVGRVIAQGNIFIDGPLDLDFSSDGKLYVYQNDDSGNSRIIILNSDGTITPFLNIEFIGGIAINPKTNEIFFTNPLEGKIYSIPKTGGIPHLFASNFGSWPSLKFNKEGTVLYAALFARQQIIKVTGPFLSLTLLSPNGGENWKVGSAHNITWISGIANNVKIEYSTNNGSTWTTITTSTPANLGSYQWTVPDFLSDQCKVRITDVDNPTNSDESDSPFNIVPAGPLAEKEPNNTANEAMNIGIVDDVYGSISSDNDVDYYKFTASAGDVVEIFGVERNGSELTGLIRLFNENGNELWSNQNFNNDPQRQRIVYWIPNSGVYYVRYSNQNNWGGYPNSAVKDNGVDDETQRMTKLEKGSQDINAALASSGEYRLTIGYFTPTAPIANNAYWNAVTYNSVMFGGDLYPNDLPTTVTFEYGLTTSYENYIQPNPEVYEGLNEVGVNQVKATGLQANTEYYFRMKVQNSAGVDYSDDQMFTTPEEPEGWVHQESGLSDYNTSIRGVYFADEKMGYAVGDRYILKTIDGGTNWTNQEINNGWGLRDLDFATSSIGVAIGENGTIARTTDGGTTWSSQEGIVTNNLLMNISFGDENFGYAIGFNGTIIKTTDGGANWNLLGNSPTVEHLRGIYFMDANKGTIVGENGIIINTTNGGTNWSLQTLLSGRTLYALHYSDANNGWAVGDGDEAYHTSDGGVTWNAQNLGDWYNLYGVYFADANNGIAVGSGGIILRTANGGNSWTREQSGTTALLRDVHYNVKATVVGYNATILRSVDYLSLYSPNGGEIWKAGLEYNIKWLSSGVDNIEIKYTTDNGSSWTVIENTYSASSGKYAWTIPNTLSAYCKVKITGNGLSDESDGSFEIKETGIVVEQEPNNTSSQAMTIAIRDTVDGSIDPESDIDYYKFTASAGDTVEIYGEARNSSDLYGLIRLFNESENELYNNNYFLGDPTKQRIVYEIQNSGTYYIRYSNQNNWGSYPNNAVKGNGEGIENKSNRMAKVDDKALNVNSLEALKGNYRIIFNHFPQSPPLIANVNWVDLNYNFVRFNGQIYPNGLDTKVTVYWGQTTDYDDPPFVVTTNANSLNEWWFTSDMLTGLQPNTEYHFKVEIKNAKGIAETGDLQFSTPLSPDGWVRLPIDTRTQLRSVDFYDDLNGVILASSGREIYFTTDGGESWVDKHPSDQPDFNWWNDVEYVNENKIIAVGFNGNRIYTTTDKGNTWSSKEVGNQWINDISFFDGNNGVFVNNDAIYKTTDGGTSWNQLPLANPNWLHRVKMVTSNIIIALGSNSWLYRSTDGGNSWWQQQVGSSDLFDAIDFLDVNNGFICGRNNTVLKTTNSGANWNLINVGTTTECYGLGMRSINDIFAAGANGTIYNTKDAGTNWNMESSGTANFLYDLAVTPSGQILIVGDWGTILRSTSTSSPIDFSVDLQVSDNCSHQSELIFGTASDATDGYDAAYDQYAPPPPLGGAFDGRLRYISEDYLKDFRATNVNSSVVWNVIYQPATSCSPVTINWNTAQLPQMGFFMLVDAATGGSIVKVDMRTANSYTDNASLGSLQIVFNYTTTKDMDIASGWNMLGLPLEVDDANYKTLYSNAITGTLYGFNGAYFSTEVFNICKGYWLRFPGAETVPIIGKPISTPQVISLSQGWNMISGLSCNIALSNVSDPGGIIIAGTLYGFNGAYYSSSELEQGQGYWIRANAAGNITLDCSTGPLAKSSNRSDVSKIESDISEFNKIEIKDGNGISQNLYFSGKLDENVTIESYSFPPVAPEGAFDVRFTSGYRLVESDEVIISIQSSSHPLTIKIDGNGKLTRNEGYTVKELVGGIEISTKTLKEQQELIINNSKVSSLVIRKGQIIPVEYSLEQNYPNPFNPTTTIKFGLPEAAKVKIKIYSVLGELITELMDQEMEAGYQRVEFNASNYASGVYLYRIETEKFNAVKKMIFMK